MPRKCDHAQATSDAESFKRLTHNRREWPETGLVVGECVCGSTLSFPMNKGEGRCAST